MINNLIRRFVGNCSGRLLLCVLAVLLMPAGVFGFEFGDVRNSLKSDISKAGSNVVNTTIAIVYNNQHRNRIKKQINLINFKKDLSEELLRSFKVVDPILIERLLDRNQVTYDSLLQNKGLLTGFAERAESSHVLFVNMVPQGRQLNVTMQLVTRQGDSVSKVYIEMPLGDATESSQVVAKNEFADDDSDSMLNRLRDNFTPSRFVDGHNESRIYFAPTGYIQPETHAVDVLAWIKKLSDVEFVWMRLMYDFKFAERFQVGFRSYGIADRRSSDVDHNDNKQMGHHSTYGVVKYQLLDNSQAPFALSTGVKARLLWDKGNTDFETGDDDLDDKNESRNKLTLFAAGSGRLENLGLLVNFYLDNQSFGTGAKFLITPDIKLFFDNMYYYYKDAHVKDDQAVGIQLYNSVGTVTTLAYQYETKQFQLGIGVNW